MTIFIFKIILRIVIGFISLRLSKCQDCPSLSPSQQRNPGAACGIASSLSSPSEALLSPLFVAVTVLFLLALLRAPSLSSSPSPSPSPSLQRAGCHRDGHGSPPPHSTRSTGTVTVTGVTLSGRRLASSFLSSARLSSSPLSSEHSGFFSPLLALSLSGFSVVLFLPTQSLPGLSALAPVLYVPVHNQVPYVPLPVHNVLWTLCAACCAL
eukprot:557116-Rhodomonas_salina.1